MTLSPAFYIQVPLFVVLWLILRQLWFAPALKVIHERAKRSEGAVAEARKVQEEADRLKREHAAALEQTRADAQREIQEMLRQADAEQRRLIETASEEAQRHLSDARSQIAEEITSARRELRTEIEAIARDVARTILGRAA